MRGRSLGELPGRIMYQKPTDRVCSDVVTHVCAARPASELPASPRTPAAKTRWRPACLTTTAVPVQVAVSPPSNVDVNQDPGPVHCTKTADIRL